jgi:hypothetical protein
MNVVCSALPFHKICDWGLKPLPFTISTTDSVLPGIGSGETELIRGCGTVPSLLNSPQLRFVCEDVRIRRLMKGRSARFMKFVGDSSRLLLGERILNTAPPGNSE